MPTTPSKFPLADAAPHLAGLTSKTARRDANQARIKTFVDKRNEPERPRSGIHPCGHPAIFSRNYGGLGADDEKMAYFGRILSIVSGIVHVLTLRFAD